MSTFFSDFFRFDEAALDEAGAFNVSLINDLPLFIDPFLLFNSEKDEYQRLHREIIAYLIFLRDKATESRAENGLLRAWYTFPEVKQNWLGFSVSGNSGSGLGMDFARELHANLHKIFKNFGQEQITESSHLEKVTLVSDGVGRDRISDFTTGLIIDFLARYTEDFARRHVRPSLLRNVSISKAAFNYNTQVWSPRTYNLPWIDRDYVILTPKDMLTRDDTWINRGDMIRDFENIPRSISNEALRAQVNNYFYEVLHRDRQRHPKQADRDRAAAATIRQFPELIDWFIRYKELHGDEATDLSSEKVRLTELLFIQAMRHLQELLRETTRFYQTSANTYEEAHARLHFLKDVIENKGGHRFFWNGNEPINREKDLHILYRLVWFGTPSDVTTEANDGRGPVDFKISRGAGEKTLVEWKLASNTQLERNLEKQVPIYQAASDAKRTIKVIIFFTGSEESRVRGIIKKLGLSDSPDLILIDARKDNKPSGSKA